jgi:replicative DNA helicase
MSGPHDGRLGERDGEAPTVPPAVRAAYHAKVAALLAAGPVRSDGAEPERPPALHLCPEAEAQLRAFRREIEPRLGRFGDLHRLVDWGAKLVGAVVRLAGLLHLARYPEMPFPQINQIEADTAGAAIALGRYFAEHARAAYDAMGQDPAVDDAQYLLKWLEPTGAATFCKRDAFLANRARFRQAEELDRPLHLLCRHGYVRSIDGGRPRARGRPASPRFTVHPALRAGGAREPSTDAS